MSLLGGGSLIYTPPIPEFERYEITGTWMCVGDDEVSFTNDGVNWQRATWGPSSFWQAAAAWVFGAAKMVIPASDIFTAAFRMTNTNPVTFAISTPGPNPGANDEFEPSFRLSHGTGGFIGTSTGVIRSSGDADNWLEELPVDGDFGDAGLGVQQFMPEVSLHIRLGAGEFPPSPGTYWTSGNGTGWTERVFPEPFDAGIQTSTAALVGNGVDVICVGLGSNGRIYRSLDGVVWSLRYDPFPEENITSMVWNPMAFDGDGAFFAFNSTGKGNPHNLLTSPDGIFWAPVDPNDLGNSAFSEIAADPGKNLMIARSGGRLSGVEFEDGGAWLSDDDGETWKEFADRRGGDIGFIDLKIGPVVDTTVAIDTGAIVISEVRADPNSVRARLQLPGSSDEANQINELTVLGGNVNLGLWALFADHLNPFYYEYRLDRIAGDDFNDGAPTAIDTWVPGGAGANWGYFFTSGVQVLSMTGTLRVRHKDTLVESNSVSVSITAELT